jgi:hypothetical protein
VVWEGWAVLHAVMEGERIGSAVGPIRRRDLPQLGRKSTIYQKTPGSGNPHSEIVPADGPSSFSPALAVQGAKSKPSGFFSTVAWAVTPFKDFLGKVLYDLVAGREGNCQLCLQLDDVGR